MKGKGSCMSEGLIKKESFKPSASSPPETSHGRPKHEGKVTRHTKGAKK
jgi:hypothetical protein